MAAATQTRMVMMFRVKICGITSEQDLHDMVAAGADAVGFNFFTGSRRYVPPQLVSTWPDTEAMRVGVFVNCPPAEIRQCVADCRLDAIQLHGDESPATHAALADLLTIRAYRFNGENAVSIAGHLEHCQRLQAGPAAVLMDACIPGHYGGSGMAADWQRLAAEKHHWGDVPIILAGGLNAENVASAVQIVGPTAVDVASGVEVADGPQKHAGLAGRFCERAREALEHS